MVGYLKYLWVHFVMCFTAFLGDNMPVLKLRGFLAGPGFKRTGKNLQLATGSKFACPGGIEIGDDVYIANTCWLQGVGGIKIEDEVMIGPLCVVASNKHTCHKGSFRFGTGIKAGIVLEKGVWLASHCVINAGVRIGEGSCIGAGSVVTKTVAPYKFYGGAPAVEIKR